MSELSNHDLRDSCKDTSCSCQCLSTCCTGSGSACSHVCFEGDLLAVSVVVSRAVRAARKAASVARDQAAEIHTCRMWSIWAPIFSICATTKLCATHPAELSKPTQRSTGGWQCCFSCCSGMFHAEQAAHRVPRSRKPTATCVVPGCKQGRPILAGTLPKLCTFLGVYGGRRKKDTLPMGASISHLILSSLRTCSLCIMFSGDMIRSIEIFGLNIVTWCVNMPRAHS
mmetsp:Transcript_26246/g.71002  ORF Transcript_26246/g.71002 Transcript_26246/m.71002 type:complete len:227 (+) Transcript_26246:889-1569(+)